MVKWPPTRGWTRHKESPGTLFLVGLFLRQHLFGNQLRLPEFSGDFRWCFFCPNGKAVRVSGFFVQEIRVLKFREIEVDDNLPKQNMYVVLYGCLLYRIVYSLAWSPPITSFAAFPSPVKDGAPSLLRPFPWEASNNLVAGIDMTQVPQGGLENKNSGDFPMRDEKD